MFGLRYLKNVTTLKTYPGKCTGCGVCTLVCPQQILKLQDKKILVIDKDGCMECGACQRNCEFDAIRVRAGVGCAAAVIQGALKKTEPACGCSCSGEKASSCCG
ncbi:4Fe-4S binding protein [candidate division KSB1 bacterium]|nr:4Fe-4S binding protein [candidate division KSB1 bacterium]